MMRLGRVQYRAAANPHHYRFRSDIGRFALIARACQGVRWTGELGAMKKLWLVVVGVMLCVTLPSVAAQPEAEQKSTKVEVVGDVHIAREVAKSDTKDAPCIPPKDLRTSDLCAQWKAADAASVSTRYAMLGLWISVFTLIGVAVTVWHTQQTVRIAHETLQADRAWITPRIPKINWEGNRDADGRPFQPILSIRLQWETRVEVRP